MRSYPGRWSYKGLHRSEHKYTWITRFPGRNLDPLEVVPPVWRESVCGSPTLIVHLLPTICVHPLHHVRRENAMSASPRDGGSI